LSGERRELVHVEKRGEKPAVLPGSLKKGTSSFFRKAVKHARADRKKHSGAVGRNRRMRTALRRGKKGRKRQAARYRPALRRVQQGWREKRPLRTTRIWVLRGSEQRKVCYGKTGGRRGKKGSPCYVAVKKEISSMEAKSGEKRDCDDQQARRENVVDCRRKQKSKKRLSAFTFESLDVGGKKRKGTNR